MKIKLGFVVFVLLCSLIMVQAAAAPQLWVKNSQENKCGYFWPGDEYSSFHPPAGWEYFELTEEQCDELLLLVFENETAVAEHKESYGSLACEPATIPENEQAIEQALDCSYVGEVKEQNGDGKTNCLPVLIIPLLFVGVVAYRKTQ